MLIHYFWQQGVHAAIPMSGHFASEDAWQRFIRFETYRVPLLKIWREA